MHLHDCVVSDDSFALGEGVWLGEHPEARVVFEGASLHLAPSSSPSGKLAVSVAGGTHPVVLQMGGRLRIELENGNAVILGVVEERRLAREALFGGDIRLLVLTAALILIGLWAETTQRWATEHPEVVAEMRALPSLWLGPAASQAEQEPVSPPKVHAPVEFK